MKIVVNKLKTLHKNCQSVTVLPISAMVTAICPYKRKVALRICRPCVFQVWSRLW